MVIISHGLAERAAFVQKKNRLLKWLCRVRESATSMYFSLVVIRLAVEHLRYINNLRMIPSLFTHLVFSGLDRVHLFFNVFAVSASAFITSIKQQRNDDESEQKKKEQTLADSQINCRSTNRPKIVFYMMAQGWMRDISLAALIYKCLFEGFNFSIKSEETSSLAVIFSCMIWFRKHLYCTFGCGGEQRVSRLLIYSCVTARFHSLWSPNGTANIYKFKFYKLSQSAKRLMSCRSLVESHFGRCERLISFRRIFLSTDLCDNRGNEWYRLFHFWVPQTKTAIVNGRSSAKH